MNFSEMWDKALSQTEVIRSRVLPLETFGPTKVPYLFLSSSSVNLGHTVIRRGEILLQKPSLIMPLQTPYFKGFEWEGGVHPDFLVNFLLVRGIQFPSLQVLNETNRLDVVEMSLERGIKREAEKLARMEDVRTSLVTGPEDAWQVSLILMLAGLVARCAEGDMRRIIDRFRRMNPWFKG